VRVRPAAVAGAFYPADAAGLASLVDRLLAEVPRAPDDGLPAAVRAGPEAGPPVGAVVPHAGYRYSGAVAATAYTHLARRRDRIDRVVVLGPAHRVPLRGMAVPGVDAFGTPLGPVGVDEEARAAATASPGVAVDDGPHAGEHSLETQLPFVQRALGSAVPVLPVLVGDTPPGQVAALLAALSAPGTVTVVSTDLSHYLELTAARDRDARTAAAILARDDRALRPADACGFFPLRGLLRFAADRDLHVRLLALATSADAGSDPHRVVGYGAFLLAG
jgi:MEMO1 family protein